MLYFKVSPAGEVTCITVAPPPLCGTPQFERFDGTSGWLDRWDIASMAHAETVAAAASRYTGRRYIATDAGDHVSPRFDVIEAPAVGDAVSMGFNGDYYPCGTIIRISASLKVVTTSDGKTFTRRGNTGTWKYGRTWSMVPGHHEELNPHF